MGRIASYFDFAKEKSEAQGGNWLTWDFQRWLVEVLAWRWKEPNSPRPHPDCFSLNYTICWISPGKLLLFIGGFWTNQKTFPSGLLKESIAHPLCLFSSIHSFIYVLSPCEMSITLLICFAIRKDWTVISFAPAGSSQAQSLTHSGHSLSVHTVSQGWVGCHSCCSSLGADCLLTATVDTPKPEKYTPFQCSRRRVLRDFWDVNIEKCLNSCSSSVRLPKEMATLTKVRKEGQSLWMKYFIFMAIFKSGTDMYSWAFQPCSHWWPLLF